MEEEGEDLDGNRRIACPLALFLFLFVYPTLRSVSLAAGLSCPCLSTLFPFSLHFFA